MRHRGWRMAAAACLALAGCSADRPVNPSFALTVADAKKDLRRMREAPKARQRPVVVLGGFMDPGIASGRLMRELVKLTGDDRIMSVSFPFSEDFDTCRRKVIEAMERQWPSDDPDWTSEVDVVAVSMGGLVARYATMQMSAPIGDGPSDDNNESDGEGDADDALSRKRLRVARLFTISTPHRGAKMANAPTFDRVQMDMRADSAFLDDLDRAARDATYELYPYVRLGDLVVGPINAAPPGTTAWWMPNRPFEPAHTAAHQDPRILADIARRLRGEQPYTTRPAAPLPTK